MRAIVTMLVVCLAPAGAAAAEDSLAVVRTVAVHAAPPGWLACEDMVFTALGERVGSLVPASVTADLWQAPGFRWDRARERIRAALNGGAEALAKNDLRAARRHTKDVAELLELGPVVAVVPASTLRRFHLLEARVASARGRGAEVAVARYLALTGVQSAGELDSVLVERTRAASAKPVGLTVDVKPARAVVYLDGERIGQGDVRRYDIAPGRHYLRVAASGHEAFGERIDLAAGGMARRTVRLTAFEDPLVARGRGLVKARPAEKEVKRLRELAENLGVGGVLALVPDEAGMTLRYYEVALGAWRPAIGLSFALAPDEVAQHVEQALGRAPPSPVLEAIDAAPAIASTAAGDPVTEPVVDTDGGFSSRWLWAGAGVAVVVGVVVTVLVVGSSESEAGRASVWLCPAGGSSCAP